MNRLRQLREERKINQEELAYALGTTQQRISLYENEKAPLTSEEIKQYAKYFSVTSDYILGLSDSRITFSLEIVQQRGMSEAKIRELIYLFCLMSAEKQDTFIQLGKVLCDK